jgi:ribonuclease Z
MRRLNAFMPIARTRPYAPQLADALRGVDLLYHEATFTEALAARAKETKHSTARQAGMLAKECGSEEVTPGPFQFTLQKR